MPNPTILLIPGSFASNSTTAYSALVAALNAKDHPAVALQLPSTRKRMPLPPATLSDDAEVVRIAVKTLVGLGREVVVVAHSYGGTVATEALGEWDGGEGAGKVKRIVYVTASVPRVGETQNVAMGTGEEGAIEAVDGYIHVDPVFLAGVISNDTPWEDAYRNSVTFTHHSNASFTQKVTRSAYKEFPVSYIVCEQDLIISPEKQRAFIRVVEDSGREVSVRSLDAGHCPNWSRVDELAAVIVEEGAK